MFKKTGFADLPLHTGTVPKWLADRMMALGTEIIEALLINYGKREVLRRLSDPLWFQSLGAVLGMDWHSSGITTSVMYALKRGINARAREFGLVVCGGRGKYSRKTPEQIDWVCNVSGLNGGELIRASKLCAKVDNTAVQDGFQLYQHNFILSDQGDWAVIQQGMNTKSQTARRYHWCSADIKSFVDQPHSAVTGENRGKIRFYAKEQKNHRCNPYHRCTGKNEHIRIIARMYVDNSADKTPYPDEKKQKPHAHQKDATENTTFCKKCPIAI